MNNITTHAVLSCPVCGSQGRILFSDLPDGLHSTPWRWSERQCTASSCGVFWLDPQPNEEEVHKLYPADYYTHGADSIAVPVSPVLGHFHDYLADGYLAAKYQYGDLAPSRMQRWLGSLGSLRINWKAWVDDSVMRLHHINNGRLLDVGFGSGRHMRTLERLGWIVSGCDQDPLAVEQARSRGRDARLGALQASSFPDNYFDAVLLSHVIEHVRDPRALLSECFRVLAPGGWLSLTTPNINSLGFRLFRRHWLHFDVPRHFTLFHRNAMLQLLSQLGFRIHQAPASLGASSSTTFQMSVALASTEQPWARVFSLAPGIFGKIFALITWASSALARGNVCEEIAVVAFKPHQTVTRPRASR